MKRCYDLLHFDLSKVNLREIPKTTALLEQKVASQDDKQGWWLDFLHRGDLPTRGDGEHLWQCETDNIVKSYLEHAKERGRAAALSRLPLECIYTR